MKPQVNATRAGRSAWLWTGLGALFVAWTLWRASQYIRAFILYPPGPDQEEYLASGAAALTHGVFFWKAPLYSLWLGLFYGLSGRGLAACFYLEKTVSVLLLALGVGLLTARLLDARSGLLAVFWVAQCKYLLLEPNNSHTLAAILVAFSALALLEGREPAKRPAFFGLLALSIFVRAEMALVVYPVAIGLLAWELRRRGLWRPRLAAWALCLAFLLLLGQGFARRAGAENRYPLIDEAFVQNFAANYVDRNQLAAEYPSPWRACHEIFQRVMPEAHSMREAFARYPGIVAGHLRYNVALSLRAVPAIVLGVRERWAMALLFALYLASYLRWEGRMRLREEARDVLGTLLGAAAALTSLIACTWLFRAAARYYIQLIPALIPLALAFLHAAFLQRLQRRRA